MKISNHYIGLSVLLFGMLNLGANGCGAVNGTGCNNNNDCAETCGQGQVCHQKCSDGCPTGKSCSPGTAFVNSCACTPATVPGCPDSCPQGSFCHPDYLICVFPALPTPSESTRTAPASTAPMAVRPTRMSPVLRRQLERVPSPGHLHRGGRLRRRDLRRRRWGHDWNNRRQQRRVHRLRERLQWRQLRVPYQRLYLRHLEQRRQLGGRHRQLRLEQRWHHLRGDQRWEHGRHDGQRQRKQRWQRCVFFVRRLCDRADDLQSSCRRRRRELQPRCDAYDGYTVGRLLFRRPGRRRQRARHLLEQRGLRLPAGLRTGSNPRPPGDRPQQLL